MSNDNEKYSERPARIEAAFDFLYHCRTMTDQCDASIPARPLSRGELSVQSAALEVLRLYLVGELDFGGPSVRKDVPEPASASPPPAPAPAAQPPAAPLASAVVNGPGAPPPPYLGPDCA